MKKKTSMVSLVAALIVSSAILPVSAAATSAPVSVSNAEAASGAAVSGDVKLDETNFPDSVFREYLKTNYDKDKNNSLSQDEILAIHEIKLGYSGVTNLKGIEFLTEITYLEVMETGITELDVTKNTKLTLIDCSNTKITNLDLSRNTALKTLWCYSAPITELDLSNNTSLGVLRASGTAITELDLSNNKELTYLECDSTNITELSLANNPKLQWLICANTKIQQLDVTHLSDLRRFEILHKNENQSFGTYIHMGGKISVLTLLDGVNNEAAQGLSMHIAANKPVYITTNDIPAEAIANETAIQMEASKTDEKLKGKPANVLENIIKGKVSKYFAESVLVEQDYLLEPGTKVGAYLKKNNLNVNTFIRYETGEGIAKRVENFAEEVQKQMQ